MKNLSYLLVVALTVIACYVIFHKPKGSEREAQLEASIKERDKIISRLEANGNLMASEIQHKDVIIAEAHEETQKATAARIYAETKLQFFKSSPIVAYNSVQRDSVIRAIASEWETRNGRQRQP